MTNESIGRVVISKAGRDRGRAFLIVGIADDTHVYLADGETRKLAAPKRTKLKQLRVEAETAETVAEKLTGGKNVLDAELRKSLFALGYNAKPEQ